MLKIYGSPLCPDCVRCKQELEEAGVAFLYLDIGEKLLYLKQFLKLRDTNTLFEPVRQRGQIGIPCIVREDNTLTFEWDEFIK